MYKNKTTFYKIPYMGNGDILVEEDEKQQMTIIDNLLYAATFGASKCLIEDGDYELSDVTENSCRVKIKPYSEYTLLGIINYRLFMYTKVLSSILMMKGAYYYIYVQYSQNLDLSPTQFTLAVETRPHDERSETKLKIAEVDFTGNYPILKYDLDKVYAKNILAHTRDTTNPHGEELTQDTLKITNKLFIAEQEIYQVIYSTIESKGQGEPYKLNLGHRTPVFVTAVGEDASIGNIYCKLLENDVEIVNSGAIGKKINLRIEVK